MNTHGYINNTTGEQFRKAHVQVTHTLRFSDMVALLALVAHDRWGIDEDEITKSQAEKSIRAILAEKGSDVLIGWADGLDDAEEIREWADEHARRWWSTDFGSV